MKENRKPLIGICGWKVGDNSYGCSTSYMSYLQRFGNVRILSPYEPIDDRLDLVVLPGGADVDPIRYGAIPELYTSRPDIMKEYFDTKIVPQYINKRIPIFGICRGVQSLGVLLGAKLVQHMVHEYTNNDKDTRDEWHHDIYVEGEVGKELFSYCDTYIFHVNSLHHQCISDEDLPKEIEVVARYYIHKRKEDSYNRSIEAFQHKALPIAGVQYHPEELGIEDPLGDYLVLNLLTRSPHFKLEKEIIHG
jgi:putative glutamine amidotransferase